MIEQRYIALKTIYFGNGEAYIIRGRKYRLNNVELAKYFVDGRLSFYDGDGNRIYISDDKNDEYYVGKLFKKEESLRY